ncbi:MAG TPA: Dabb family protein [Acidimicrobiales bacterium]|nr:Dabb family protein [Acidimicrobiales bacterium]
MIRNVTVVKLKPDADQSLADRAVAEIQTLEIDGMVSIVAGRDLGLKEGTFDLVVTCDFVDEAAYRRYDTDGEHDRMRRELFFPISEQIVRAQLALPD